MSQNNIKKFDSWEQAREAVASMQEYGIKPEANHFAVWLAYHSGSMPNLCEDLGGLIAKSKQIDEHVCASLFERYIEREALSEKIMEAGSTVANEIRDIMVDINAVEQKTRAFGTQLATAKTALANTDDAGKINNIVTSLSSATQDMEDHSKALETRLIQSRNEIESLRSELEQVRTEAAIDSLTGVSNRKSFDTTLANEMEKSKKTRKPLSLIMADIDFFKRINDTWGHQTGDQVICFVAGVMQREMPKGAIVARIGGEEFALVAPDTDEMQARALAERIRKIVENKRLVRRASKEDLGQITISLGYTVYDKVGAQADLVENADQALYSSKRNGRNRVTASSNSQKTKAA